MNQGMGVCMCVCC